MLQSQLIVLSSQILWSERVEAALSKMASSSSSDLGPLQGVVDSVQNLLNILADSVLKEQPAVRRKKLEHLVGDFLPVPSAVLGVMLLKISWVVCRL